MKTRPKTLVIAAAVILAAGFVLFSRNAPRRHLAVARTGADSVWYHASDAALLARTNRPQLVEFFHPD